jgi:hypothetical protein
MTACFYAQIAKKDAEKEAELPGYCVTFPAGHKCRACYVLYGLDGRQDCEILQDKELQEAIRKIEVKL